MTAVKDMESLCYPGSICLIGASGKEGKVGNIILQNLSEWRKPLYLIHPSEREIRGKKVHAELAEIPDNLDLGIIALDASRAVDAAAACASKGFKAVIIVAGGFSEIGHDGAALEEQLRQQVLAKGTRVLGPNTLGIFIPGTGLDTIFVEHGDRMFAKPGEVAFITQSGSVGVEALGASGVIGWGLRAFVGTGNRLDIGENELIEFFADDDRTRCIALYLESFADGRVFVERCRKIAPSKPVVVLKAGRSEAAIRAVASHTGKMASPGDIFFGAGRQVGIQLAENEEQLTDYAKILSKEPAPANPKVAVITSAGGYGIITLDLLAETRYLQVADLSAQTVTGLRKVTPSFASLGNPIDLTASVDNAMMDKTLEILEEDRGVGIIFCIAFFAPPKIDRGLIEVLADHRRRTKKPLILFVAYGPFTSEIAFSLYEKGVMVFTSLSRAVRAMDALAERG
ncbi:MAG: CoA-binding protein, partial [Deltaproteobacteria bacterium]|nr:CoA-binding protein [Deltaproteobacteria bacterium]